MNAEVKFLLQAAKERKLRDDPDAEQTLPSYVSLTGSERVCVANPRSVPLPAPCQLGLFRRRCST